MKPSLVAGSRSHDSTPVPELVPIAFVPKPCIVCIFGISCWVRTDHQLAITIRNISRTPVWMLPNPELGESFWQKSKNMSMGWTDKTDKPMREIILSVLSVRPLGYFSKKNTQWTIQTGTDKLTDLIIQGSIRILSSYKTGAGSRKKEDEESKSI